MSDVQGYTEAERETAKLFDTLRKVRNLKENFAKKPTSQPIEIDGRVCDAEKITDAMLAIDILRFKELVDMCDPFYADFISEFEQLPGMPETMELYDQFKAEEAAG